MQDIVVYQNSHHCDAQCFLPERYIFAIHVADSNSASLELSRNDLTGSIPESWGRLSNLRKTDNKSIAYFRSTHMVVPSSDIIYCCCSVEHFDTIDKSLCYSTGTTFLGLCQIASAVAPQVMSLKWIRAFSAVVVKDNW